MARPGLTLHRKFLTLCRMLGIRKPQALGHLELMWMGVYETGDPLLGNADDVEDAADWYYDDGGVRPERGAFFEAVLNCGGPGHSGFIEEAPGKPGFYQVHDLFHHAPDYVSRRRDYENERRREKSCAHCGTVYHSPRAHSRFCCNACRVAEFRVDAKKKVTDSNGANRNDVTHVTQCNATPAPAPAPLSKEDCSEPVPPTAEPPSPSVLVFPCKGKGLKTWNLTALKVKELRECYPGVDVLAQCRRALQWCRDNETKQKTARGMGAFVNRWLAKEQDRGSHHDGKPKDNDYAP